MVEKKGFNFLSSSCRNIIEFTFHVSKVHSCILKDMATYHLDTHVDIMLVIMAIHNHFKRKNQLDEEFEIASSESCTPHFYEDVCKIPMIKDILL